MPLTSMNRKSDTYPHPQVLKTKLYKPNTRKEYVKREDIISRLEQNVLLPLTVFSAATGCGKSVTTSQWLDETGYNYGWISLDDDHNDLHVFLTYLNTLLKGLWPQYTFGLESLLENINISVNLIITTLVNDLDLLEDHFVLVLDDYHTIKEEKIHEIINGILKYPPNHLHLVILTQVDPPLKLARMRAQNRLNEFRMKDLAFSHDEALRLRSTTGTEITDDQMRILVEKAEGWITGISVGLIGLSQGVEFEKVIQSMDGRNMILSDLLDETIIKRLKTPMQKFLALTSLVDQFSNEVISTMVAAINDHELSQSDSEEYMHLSIQRNLFLISLDSTGQWYRYHHIFRSQVKKRVGQYFKEGTIQKVHKAVSKWFDANGFLEEAMKYAILSKDMSMAVALFDKHRISLHNSEQFQKLERLLKQFPEDEIESNLELLLSLTILQDHKANFSGMEKYLEQAEVLIQDLPVNEPSTKSLKGQFHCVSSYLKFMRGDFEGAIQVAGIGMELLPPLEPNYFREFALAYYSMANQATGNKEIGLKLISRTLDYPAQGDKYFRGRLLHIKILIHSIAGDIKEMRRYGIQLQALHSPQSYASAWMAGILAVATSSYVSNRLQKVHQFHEELFVNRFIGRPFGTIHHFFIECLASEALGNRNEVDSYIKNCKELAADLDIPVLEETVYAFEVEIALTRNEIDLATEAAARANFNPHPPIWYYYIPQLTEVKLLFHTNEEEKALARLEELIGTGRSYHNENLLIQSQALKAILHEKKGDHKKALELITEALRLSENKGNIRTFADHGIVMQQLMNEIPKDQFEISLIRAIDQALLDMDSEKFNTHKKIRYFRDVDDSLSKRELEILKLVTKGYKNEEIADQLFVSLDTVKKHLYNAYQKLNVSNRVRAIKKVQELGMLT